MHGGAVPANAFSGLSPRETIDLLDIALVPGVGMVDPATLRLPLALSNGGTASLLLTALPGAQQAAAVVADGTGGSAITFIYVASVPGAPGGTLLVPMGNGAYVTAAQTAITAASGGAIQFLHAGGSATVAPGTALFAADAMAPVTLAGGSTDGQLIVTGTSFLFAGTGNDILREGTGLTQFVMLHGLVGGHVTIEDWNPTHAQVALSGYAPGETAAALAGATAAGGNLTITLSDGTSITFLGTSTLSPSSFI